VSIRDRGYPPIAVIETRGAGAETDTRGDTPLPPLVNCFFILFYFFCFVFWGVLKKPKTFEEAIVYFLKKRKLPN
jgi:hypothetical protein